MSIEDLSINLATIQDQRTRAIAFLDALLEHLDEIRSPEDLTDVILALTAQQESLVDLLSGEKDAHVGTI